jgi:DNA invertase Pin-like site-specific DNA recombinase
MKRVIIYARVSTKEQSVDMQLIDLREYAKVRKLKIIQEYIDYASGSRNDRKNYQRLLNDVRKGKTDAVLVWRFDLHVQRKI